PSLLYTLSLHDALPILSFQLSYTYTRARDQSSFSSGASSQGFAAASTAGDPNVREWGTSSFERHHSFLGTLTYPITAALEITGIDRKSTRLNSSHRTIS